MHVVEIQLDNSSISLKLSRRPIPFLSAGEVLVKVSAFGINRADILQKKGHYPPPLGASDLLGLEVAGTIVSGQIDHHPYLKIGSLVCALLSGGGYAEYVAVPIEHCLPIPSGLSLLEAASLPEALFTAWMNLVNLANVQDIRFGQVKTILIHGGSSGIGVMSIQLVKALGHNVVVTAGSDEKCKACLQLGADYAINYRQFDFVEEIKCWTQNKGVDVILDMVAGDYTARNLKILAPGGHLANIAFLGGKQGLIDHNLLIQRNLTITGANLRGRSLSFKSNLASQLYNQVWPFIIAKKIKPVIDTSFPVAKINAAHALMESSLHMGKLVSYWY